MSEQQTAQLIVGVVAAFMLSFWLNVYFLRRVLRELDELKRCMTDPDSGLFVRLAIVERRHHDDRAYEGPERRRRVRGGGEEL